MAYTETKLPRLGSVYDNKDTQENLSVWLAGIQDVSFVSTVYSGTAGSYVMFVTTTYVYNN